MVEPLYLSDPDEESRLHEIRELWDRTKTTYLTRDAKMEDVFKIRCGRMREVYPMLFPEEGPFDESIVANMIDVAGRDLAEVLSPLPSFNCNSGTQAKDRARRFAEKRTMIAYSYVERSDLQVQMYSAADRYFTFGFTVAMVEIDTEAQGPRIMFHDSLGTYPVFNRWGQLKAVFFTFTKTRDELAAEYPESEAMLRPYGGGNTPIEVVRYHDAKMDVLFFSQGKDTCILQSAANPVGECLAEWIARPGLNRETRGQFDDVLAVQVAKSRFALLSLEAATKAVQAPIVMPPDAQELALGSDSLIRTASGEKVRRVPLEIPASAFATQSVLDEELRSGSRYPGARTGEVDGSIVTGRGVQALMSGFDTQIRTGQAMFARAFKELIRKCFLVDEKVFGDVEKTVRGNDAGVPYEIVYTPKKDIKGDYTCDVQYGLMAGLNPNQALVFGLQARGDNLISRAFMREQFPFALNIAEEEQQIDVEELRDALKQAIAGYAQSIPILSQNGVDPGQVLSRLTYIIQGRQKGQPIEELVAEAFEPAEPVNEMPEPAGVEMPGAAGAPGEAPPAGSGDQPAELAGLNDATGNLRGVAWGQAGRPPGGAADLQMLLAGIGPNGQANLSAGVSRRIPVR